jgi:hypothetical protein
MHLCLSPQVSLSASAFGTPRAPTLRLRCLSKLHQYLLDHLYAQSNPERFSSSHQSAVLDQLFEYSRDYHKETQSLCSFNSQSCLISKNGKRVGCNHHSAQISAWMIARYSTLPGVYPTRASVTDIKRGSPKDVTIATNFANSDVPQTCPRLEVSRCKPVI